MSSFIQHCKIIILQLPRLLKNHSPSQTLDPFLQHVHTSSIMYINEFTKCSWLSIAILYTVMIFNYNVDLHVFIFRFYSKCTMKSFHSTQCSQCYYIDTLVSMQMPCLIRDGRFCIWSRGFHFKQQNFRMKKGWTVIFRLQNHTIGGVNVCFFVGVKQCKAKCIDSYYIVQSGSPGNS